MRKLKCISQVKEGILKKAKILYGIHMEEQIWKRQNIYKRISGCQGLRREGSIGGQRREFLGQWNDSVAC